jgi:alanine-glyoxylate transaminase / serine-glyoxylate transaminase / serine-pyruvate transaminase
MPGGYAGEAAGSGGRTYLHTAPTGRMLHEGLQEMGLELFAAEGHRLPELTTVKVPDGVDSTAVRKELLERYDIEIGAGAGAYAGTVWRICLMGATATPDKPLLVRAVLKEVGGH